MTSEKKEIHDTRELNKAMPAMLDIISLVMESIKDHQDASGDLEKLSPRGMGVLMGKMLSSVTFQNMEDCMKEADGFVFHSSKESLPSLPN